VAQRLDVDPTLAIEVAGGWSPEWLPSEVALIDLEPGTRIFREGELGHDLYLVLSGTVKLTRRSTAGREVLIGLRGPNDHFGQAAAFDSAPRGVTARALTRAQVARIPQSVLVPWLLRHPEISLEILRTAAQRVKRNNSVLADMIGLKVSNRVAKQLLGLAAEFGRTGPDGIWVEHQLSQTELAHLAGTSRETCNKVLGEFARAGYLRVEMRSILIIDIDRLRAAAASAPVTN
jgi:CRP/FNR family cyclic AMP-dependent transcriptional regulator